MRIFVALIVLVVVSCAGAGRTDRDDPAPIPALPLDPAVVHGRLGNGLTYYVRHNSRPGARAELRLVVGIGSVQEEADQRGLAHFVEHMAFNGTRRFRKQELVNFLETIGIRFGADLNAYTSTDETVYMLQVPTDSLGLLQRGLDVLEEWAYGISFDSVEINKERGVVVDEWRSRLSAESRMRDQHLQVMFKGSRYADRQPIGSREILDTFHHDRLRAFYRDWYRPELMAVVAVGDFDVDSVVSMIRERFERIAPSEKRVVAPKYAVPDHADVLYSIATDPEATRASISLYWKHPSQTIDNERDFRRAMTEACFHNMLAQRFYEVGRQPEPPFQYAYTSKGRYTPTKDLAVLGAGVDERKFLVGLDAALLEVERVKRYGFLPAELERQKTELLRGYRSAFAEREKTESGRLASEYSSHFLQEGPALGIERELALAEQLVPNISLDEVNAVAQKLMGSGSRVVTLSAPQREGVVVPKPEEIAAVLDRVAHTPLEAYTEDLIDRPLVDPLPTAGTIVSESRNDTVDVTEWRLSNGIRVFLKRTEFKNDEVLLSAFSPGGTSLASDEDYYHASSAVAAATEGGLGAFDRVALEKALTGKIAGVTPYVSEREEGLSGYASPRDLETLFQLVYLTVTSPRFDSAAFESYRSKAKIGVRNRSARPESALSDSLASILSGYHPRSYPWTESTYDRVRPIAALEFYRDRFSDAGDFTFVIVGNFDSTEIRRLVAMYVASLPASGRQESWRDIGERPPDARVERTIRRGTEPKARVRLVFTGPFDWSLGNRSEIFAMNSVLEIMLRESLREDKGGTYSVGTWASPVRYPKERFTAGVSFGCDPGRVDELITAAMAVIDSLKAFGPSDENMAKIRETARREQETFIKENRFWLSQMRYSLVNGEPLSRVYTATQEYELVSAERIRDAARRYLDPNRLISLVLLPEEGR